MSEQWQPIETCQEGVEVLTYCPLNEGDEFAVDSFQWITEVRNELVSESQHASGKRKTYEERTERRREWKRGWGAEYWMPLPKAPQIDDRTLSQR